MTAEIANDPPDAGVVTSNATTASDAGSSDRFAPVVDVVRSKRDAFRCCFDVWAKKNPGQQGRVTLVLDLDPDGKLRKAEIDPATSALQAPELGACMVEVAGKIGYPRSPSGRDTLFRYPFEFRAK
jgi:hypothetical protein